MKQGKGVFILIVIAFAVLSAAVVAGWALANNYAQRLEALQREQIAFKQRLYGLKGSVQTLSRQLRVNVESVRDVEQAIVRDRAVSKETVLRIEAIAQELNKWEDVYDEMIARIDKIDRIGSAVQKEPIREVELGEIAIEKSKPE